MSARQVQIIGGGRHAKVVIRALQILGYTVVRIFDDDAAKWGTRLLDIPLVGPVEQVRDLNALPTLIAVGDNTMRKRLAQALQIESMTLVHPTAFVDASVQLNPGSIVLAGAVVQVDCRIGQHVIINTSASVDHDSVVEDFVHVSSGVTLAGQVYIREGAFLGTGSVCIPGVTVGAWTTVGAGAAVVKDLPPSIVAVGVPARPVVRNPD